MATSWGSTRRWPEPDRWHLATSRPKTGTAERYVREWLNNQAAAGYVTYDPVAKTYMLPDEQAMVVADEDSPVFLCGGFQGIASAFCDEAKITEAFRTGKGVGWHEHDPRLFTGTERFFKAGYKANLTTSWIPSLTDAEGVLKAGGRLADVGCGHGASTIVMAKAYPKSTFVGYDYHSPSIDAARKAAAEAGVGDRVTFEVASAQDFPGTGFDVVAFFDCLHDMGDPVGAAGHVHKALKPNGTLMLVEPFAGDAPEDNHTVIGKAFYGFSTMICTPASLSQDVGLALGAQAGEARLREVLTEAGFTSVRRATETPFNLVIEARP